MNEIKRLLELVVWINFFPKWLGDYVTSMFLFIGKFLHCGDKSKIGKNVFLGVQIRICFAKNI
jgi:hypothetical protein